MRRFVTPFVVLLLAALAIAAPASGAGDPLRSQQWGLDMIEADAAHQVTTGTGAIVAVIDTGVYASHADLAGRLLPGHDFVQNDSTPQDENGHGTHVTGIVAADAGNGVGIEGVAPGASILPLRALDAGGSGTSTDIAKAIDYAVAHGANVINLSLGDVIPGGVVADQEFDSAIGRALDAGVVVVAAAGNDGLPVCEQSSADSRLLCVGAVDKRGMRSFYSSFGVGVGIMAPGGSNLPLEDEDILSTWNDGGYEWLAGTSQATPHVSGVAALLVSLGLRGQDVVKRIVATAKPAGPTDLFGAGIVDAKAAVAGLGGSTGTGGTAGGTASSGGSGAPGVSGQTRVRASASVNKRQRIGTVLRKGIRIRCRSSVKGRCSARVRAKGKTIAAGATVVKAGHSAVCTARLTAAGRRLLRRARGLTAKVEITLPGGAKVVRTLKFVR
jgi:subtilisin family serine protease